MVVYGAVVSLLQTLETILHPGGPRNSHVKTQLESLHGKVSLLVDFLENSSSYKTSKDSALESLETKIRDAAYEAEDLIESHISNQLLAGPETKSSLGKEPETKSFSGKEPETQSFSGEEPETKSFLSKEPETKRPYPKKPKKKKKKKKKKPETKSSGEPIQISGRYFTVHLYHVGTFLIVVCLLMFMPAILVKPVSIRTLMPVDIQDVIFALAQILLPFIFRTVIPFLIVSLIAVGFTFLIHKAVLKGISFAAQCRRYDSQFKDQAFHQVGISSAGASGQCDPQSEDQVFHKVGISSAGASGQCDPQSEDQVFHQVGISSAGASGQCDPQSEDQVFHQVGIPSADTFTQYDSLLKDPNFCKAMDDISSITIEVIKIKGTRSVGQDTQCRNVLSSTYSSSRYDSGGSGNNVVVGLDSDLTEIKARLTRESPKIEIVSVVGMGGIGKTTLARKAYDSYIGSHFDARAWVTISQEYSPGRVLQSLLESAGKLKENMSEKSEALLSECLHKSLKGRRYLIVMDDIWDTEIWDAVKISFPEDNNGSRVLLTTRLAEVALYASSCSRPHRMHFLNQDESWKLLCNKVFGGKDCPSELQDIGKEIARNCGGLPLAISVIGGLLSKVSRTAEYWNSVADNLSSVVAKDDKQCMEILSLSYNHLPHRLRACFLYMGVFPEDHEIPVQKLIRLWAAEGFLGPSGSESLEELAEEYLKDLIERNLILVCKRSRNGKTKTCNIHDLLRNLCMQIAKKEKFLHVMICDNDVGHAKNARRLSIHPNILSTHSKIVCTSHNSRAHSLLCTGTRLIHSSHVYLQYRLLRVLDLIIVHFFDFPAEIIKLVHLRYLALTYNKALPSSISKLWNLQTLIHHNWTYRQCRYLPVEILMMPKLRHIYVTPAYFPDPHVGILVNNSFLLENLQTLSEVRNFKCGNDILKRIPNLKQLEISYDVSPSVKWSAYQLEALVNLHELETLKILIKNPYHTSEIVNPPKLAFPPMLKILTLGGCGIPWESMMIVGALENLEVLKLRKNACRGTEWKPVDGQFCKLKYLLLEEIDLVNWEANESHFPLLEHLVIRSCYKLNEIPCGICEIPTLQMIELVDCHSSAVTSAKQLQEEQESNGNEDLKLRVDLRRRFKNKFYSRILH